MATKYFELTAKAGISSFQPVSYNSSLGTWLGVAAIDTENRVMAAKLKTANAKEITRKEYNERLGKSRSRSSNLQSSLPLAGGRPQPLVAPVAGGGAPHPGSPDQSQGQPPSPGEGRVAEGKGKEAPPISVDDLAQATKLPETS
jgi:hypothetical protein